VTGRSDAYFANVAASIERRVLAVDARRDARRSGERHGYAKGRDRERARIIRRLESLPVPAEVRPWVERLVREVRCG
jgi:hypothetical protein